MAQYSTMLAKLLQHNNIQTPMFSVVEITPEVRQEMDEIIAKAGCRVSLDAKQKAAPFFFALEDKCLIISELKD